MNEKEYETERMSRIQKEKRIQRENPLRLKDLVNESIGLRKNYTEYENLRKT